MLNFSIVSKKDIHNHLKRLLEYPFFQLYSFTKPDFLCIFHQSSILQLNEYKAKRLEKNCKTIPLFIFFVWEIYLVFIKAMLMCMDLLLLFYKSMIILYEHGQIFPIRSHGLEYYVKLSSNLLSAYFRFSYIKRLKVKGYKRYILQNIIQRELSLFFSEKK